MTAETPPDAEDHPLLQQRRMLHQAIEDMLRLDPSYDEDVLSGWLLVFETAGLHGERTLVSRSGDATGENDLLPWTAEGWARYAASDGLFEPAALDDEDE